MSPAEAAAGDAGLHPTGGVRSLAFYLPQYHPIPENDAWWGPGFTEWTNVARARPQFPGHYQPHLPAHLGFYDLRVAETRARQAELAHAHGIHGFVYYHYWFNGRRILERPFREVLDSGQPDFPFCLAWANEPWTRAWDGGTHDVLLAQHHDLQDDASHIRALIPAFADPRYVHWAGRPVFLVYRAGLLPDSCRTTDLWRREVVASGLPEPYLLRIESFPDEVGDPADGGFDAAVEFQPRWWDLGPGPRWLGPARRLARDRGPFRHQLHRYSSVVDRAVSREHASYVRWPGLTPMWDNSARRRSGALILTGSTPQAYECWLRAAVDASREVAGRTAHPTDALVFVNAWNEWAEGNHLEPDQRTGLGYLAAHRRALGVDGPSLSD